MANKLTKFSITTNSTKDFKACLNVSEDAYASVQQQFFCCRNNMQRKGRYASFTHVCNKGHGFIAEGLTCPWCFGTTSLLICKCCGEAKPYKSFAWHNCNNTLPTSVVIRTTRKTAHFSLGSGEITRQTFEKLFSQYMEEDKAQFRDYKLQNAMILEPINNDYNNGTSCFFYQVKFSPSLIAHVEKYELKRIVRNDHEDPNTFITTQLQAFRSNNSAIYAPALVSSPNMPHKFITMYQDARNESNCLYIEYSHSLYEFLSSNNSLGLYCHAQASFVSNVVELAYCSDMRIRTVFYSKDKMKSLIDKAKIAMTGNTGMASPAELRAISLPFIGIIVLLYYHLKNLMTNEKDDEKPDDKSEDSLSLVELEDNNKINN